LQRTFGLGIVLLAFLITGVHLFREFDLGNVNLLLLFGCFWVITLVDKRQDLVAGALLGCVILFKPHFLVLLPFFIILPRPKLLISAVLVMALGLLWPAFFRGWDGNLHLIKAWAGTMGGHNSAGELLRDHQTVLHWIGLIFPALTARAVTFITLSFAVILYGIIFFLKPRSSDPYEKEKYLRVWFWLVIALIPNLTMTDTEHFLFSLPLVFTLLQGFKGASPALKILSIVSFLLYGFNWPDLWGHKMWVLIHNSGALGIGNFMMVILSAVSHTRRTS
jgi:hypothetical protein